MHKINILEKLGQVTEHWSPKIIAELNNQHVKLAKFQGPFTWHHHENEDELFYVIKGSFVLVVPKGVEHRPNAAEEVWVMLFEPAGTLNTGNTENEFTKKRTGKIIVDLKFE